MNAFLKNAFRIFFYFLIFSGSCGSPYRPSLIAQKWKVKSIEKFSPKEGTRTEKELSYIIIYHFKETGEYTLQIGEDKDGGNWKMSTDNQALKLTSYTGKKDDFEFRIEELNNYQLVLSTETVKGKEKFVLIPIGE